jgi:hypothetical protein
MARMRRLAGVAAKGRRSGGKRSTASRRLQTISKSTAQIVMDAASLLDAEVAAGIVAAKKVQRSLQKHRRLPASELKQAVGKFQSDAHELVNILHDQITRASSKQNTALAKRFAQNAGDVVDLAVELVNMGTELAAQLSLPVAKRNAASHSTKRK